MLEIFRVLLISHFLDLRILNMLLFVEGKYFLWQDNEMLSMIAQKCGIRCLMENLFLFWFEMESFQDDPILGFLQDFLYMIGKGAQKLWLLGILILFFGNSLLRQLPIHQKTCLISMWMVPLQEGVDILIFGILLEYSNENQEVHRDNYFPQYIPINVIPLDNNASSLFLISNLFQLVIIVFSHILNIDSKQLRGIILFIQVFIFLVLDVPMDM